MSALQALRTSDRTFPRHQGWKVYEIVPLWGTPLKTPFSPQIPIYNKVYRTCKVARKVSVSCTYPPFFVRWQPLYGGGLARVLNIHLFQNEHPVWTSTWTSTPSKSPFFILFALLLKPHLKPVLMPFSHRSNLGAYKAPCTPETPVYKGLTRTSTKKATRVNVQPYVRKPFASLM